MIVANVRIETWGDRFIVVGEFNGLTEIPRREFKTYAEALSELAKAVQREEIRYATSIGRRFDR